MTVAGDRVLSAACAGHGWPLSSAVLGPVGDGAGRWVGCEAGGPQAHKEGSVVRRPCLLAGSPAYAPVGNRSLVLCFSGQLGEKQLPSSASDDRVKDEFSDLSEG